MVGMRSAVAGVVCGGVDGWRALGLSKRTYMRSGALKASLPALKARPGWRKSALGIRPMNSLSIAAALAED